MVGRTLEDGGGGASDLCGQCLASRMLPHPPLLLPHPLPPIDYPFNSLHPESARVSGLALPAEPPFLGAVQRKEIGPSKAGADTKRGHRGRTEQLPSSSFTFQWAKPVLRIYASLHAYSSAIRPPIALRPHSLIRSCPADYPPGD